MSLFKNKNPKPDEKVIDDNSVDSKTTNPNADEKNSAKKKINFNMEIGTPKKLKNDINFFEAYKQEARAASGSMRSMIISCVCFLLIIGLAFGGIKIATSIFEGKTAEINEELASEDFRKQLNEVATDQKENENLIAYLSVVNVGNDAFKELYKLDSGFMKKIAKATPSSTKVTSINLATTQMQIFCESKKFLDSSTFMQALVRTKIFTNVSFSSNVWDDEKQTYSFTMMCLF